MTDNHTLNHLLVLTFNTSVEYAEKVLSEVREHTGDDITVRVVHTEEEARSAIEAGGETHAYLEWAHIPNLKVLREWTKAQNVQVFRPKWEDRRVRECYRGAWGYNTRSVRCGVELV